MQFLLNVIKVFNLIILEPFRFLFLIAFLKLIYYFIEIDRILVPEEQVCKFVTLKGQRVQNKMAYQYVAMRLNNLL